MSEFYSRSGMKLGKWYLIPLAILCFLTITTWILLARNEVGIEKKDSGLKVSDLMGDGIQEGFSMATGPRPFHFPEDHGPHPDFRNEWWYYTGNLEAPNGRRFGYQFTLFRNALSPKSPEKTSNWRTNQIYMGHFALTDVEENRFFFSERFSRENIELAGSITKPFRVWLENWEVTGDSTKDHFPQTIRAKTEEVELELELTSSQTFRSSRKSGAQSKRKPSWECIFLLFFHPHENPGSSENSGNTVSGPRSQLDGSGMEYQCFGKRADRLGLVRTSAFGRKRNHALPDKARKRQTGFTSKGVVVDQNGKTTPLDWNDLKLEVLGSWTSPETGVQYPSGWKLSIPSENLNFQINPLIENQELRTSVNYWEGAVEVVNLLEQRKEFRKGVCGTDRLSFRKLVFFPSHSVLTGSLSIERIYLSSSSQP